MLDREPLAASLRNRLRGEALNVAGGVVRWTRERMLSWGAIGPRSSVAAGFGSFGDGSIICFPPASIVNPGAIHLGAGTMIAPDVTLSAGWMPDQADLGDRVVGIGDRCLIGRGSSVVGHCSIEIGDDVWTGHHVHITDMNHGYTDLDLPISRQNQPESPVSIGAGSWLGHGVIVLPGSRIGRHVTVGAGSVVTGELPDNSVAVGVPARVVRVHDHDRGWISVDGVPPVSRLRGLAR